MRISSTVWRASPAIWLPATLEIDPNAEDIHTFVEQTLTARIGDAGKRLHTGRSRNDQVALDIRLTLRDCSATCCRASIVELVKVHLQKGGGEHRLPSCPATPICSGPSPSPLATHLMAYA